MGTPALKILQTSSPTSDLPVDATIIEIVDSGDGTPKTDYTLNRVFSNPIAYIRESDRFRQLSDTEFSYTVGDGNTTFTFNNVQIGDKIIVFSNTGNFLSPDMFVIGSPTETFERTGSFYLYADGADFVDVTVAAEDLVASGGAKANWITFSLDQTNWASSLDIGQISDGELLRIYYRVQIPPEDRDVLELGVLPDVAIVVNGTAVI